MGLITPKIILIGDGIFERDMRVIIDQIRRHSIPGHGEIRENLSKIQRFIVEHKEAVKLIIWDVSAIEIALIPEVVKKQMESGWNGLTVALTAKPHMSGRIKSLFPSGTPPVLNYSEITIERIKELLKPTETLETD
jgi:hypothetical protein